MHSVPQLRPTTNPYLVGLLDGQAADHEVHTFSWRRALRLQFDVLHLHWPENLIRGRTRLGTIVRRVLLVALLGRLALGRRAVVRTFHNVAPHEAGGAIERMLLRRLDRRTNAFVRLNGQTEVPERGDRPDPVIPIPTYAPFFADCQQAQPVAGRLVFFGLIRRYKGIESLLEAFAGVGDPAWRLHIAGQSAEPELTALIESAAERDGRIRARLEHLPDDDLAEEITAAEVVVLPYPEMHNSAAALLALSLGRPVVVPDNPITADLAAEVGEPWVIRYTLPLTADKLHASVLAARLSDRASAPDLSRRSWAAVLDAHRELYRALVRPS